MRPSTLPSPLFEFPTIRTAGELAILSTLTFRLTTFNLRFCFEILTPSSRRIYQATTEREMYDWVAAITKSIESLLNG